MKSIVHESVVKRMGLEGQSLSVAADRLELESIFPGPAHRPLGIIERDVQADNVRA